MKLSTQEKTARKAINDRMLVTFKGTDGKQHTVKWLAEQAVKLSSTENTFAENLFIVAQGMKQPEFDAFDKDVRSGMKWGKAPAKADDTTKALYGATPRAWKNICSIINQSFKHSIDIKQYKDVYGKEGISQELKARKDASGSSGSGVKTEGQKAIETLYPEIAGHIMHVTALDEAIKAQPDSKAMLDAVMTELTDAVDRCEAILSAGIDTSGSIDLDAELAKELSKSQPAQPAQK